MFVSIQGVSFFEHSKTNDRRGYFRRISDLDEIRDLTLLKFVQSSVSFNTTKGTVRGLHFQSAPSLEWKYVTCLSGSLFDCLVDVRRESLTYGKHMSFELSEENGKSVLIPPGVAHGFQTLEDKTLINYQMSEVFNPTRARNLLWNDSSLSIEWPLDVTEISETDAHGESWPVEY